MKSEPVFFNWFLKGLGFTLGIVAGIVVSFVGLMVFVLIQSLLR